MNGTQIVERHVKPQDFMKRVALRRAIPQVTPAVWSGAQVALGREDLLECGEQGVGSVSTVSAMKPPSSNSISMANAAINIDPAVNS